MAKLLTNLTFEEWVRYLFDHPVTDPGWHFDIDADDAKLEPQQVVSYATRLFEGAGELLAPYTDAQVNQGLWFLISEGVSPLYTLNDPVVPLPDRVGCVRAITEVFKQCFLPRCTPHLSAMDEPGAGALNPVCYMWWDIFPLRGEPQDESRREINAARLLVMETTLELPSVACQESALHGLAHWGIYYKEPCQNIISAFLRRHPDLRPELREYAECAKHSHVL
ncbi:MAG: hypothetical protein HZC54_21425 [Verrucomicrobia bacterium]|nr:hypothetical protein [Verrucomicrobiota bacterium]